MAAEQDPLSRLAFAEEVIVSSAHAQTAPAKLAGSAPTSSASKAAASLQCRATWKRTFRLMMTSPHATRGCAHCQLP